ncbi:hypothetical protein CB0940_04702 [Cercospora beticola]|uniref:Uncharacterized protein n=1 Tax=Cercospora beticola TaxID=122368 RepID=A0A2G5HJB9_CERBT|nr:hypothetical protein CB0940_04702 [Cercospora beticola]PIA92629.1 hypothetical protein CB0940_04702 [Cercospora beticola]WPB01964.1 hypothetical protein RHO25_006598 [Cercospora beticola]
MAALEVLQSAQRATLEFTAPLEGSADLKAGESVDVAWNTPWELTTLELWRGPARDGSFAVNVLAANLTQDVTTYLWNVPDNEDQAIPFQLRLQKGDQPSECAECVASTSSFQIESAASRQTSPTADTTSSPPAAAPASSRPALSREVQLGVGLGVGLGIPFVVTLVAFIFLCRRKRQRRQHQIQQLNNVHRRQQELMSDRDLRFSTGAYSSVSRFSEKSYHGPFEFEEEPGKVKPGWERLFGRNGLPFLAAPEKAKDTRGLLRH